MTQNTSAAVVPQSVTIAAGTTSAQFSVSTQPVTSTQSAKIRATYGASSIGAQLTVNPPAVSTVAISPINVAGGASATGTVTLTSPAVQGGTAVSLTSNQASVTVPNSVLVTAGTTSATFAITTQSVSTETLALITALAPAGSSRQAALTVQALGGLANSSWPKFQGNAMNSGLGISSGAKGNIKWSYGTAGQVWTPLAIGSNGTIAFGTISGNLAVYSTSGEQLWVRNLTVDGLTYAPAIGPDGSVYASVLHNKLYAFDAQGNQKWTFEAGDIMRSGPAVGPDGTIYVSSNDGNLYALSSNGKTKWTSGYNSSSPPAFGADGTIYTSNGGIAALNPNGTLKWASTGPANFNQTVAVAKDGTLISAGSADGGSTFELVATNPTGTLKWTSALPSDSTGAPSIGPDGSIYVPCLDGALRAFNFSGKSLWAFQTKNIRLTSPTFGKGNIYVSGIGDPSGYLWALSPTGAKKWSMSAGGVPMSIVDTDGTLYLGAEPGQLYAVNGDGSVAWCTPTIAAFSCPVIAPDGTILTCSGSTKTIFAFNQDGTIRWRHRFPDDVPVGLAIAKDGTIYASTTLGKVFAFHPDGSLSWSFATDSRVYTSPNIGSDGSVYVGTLNGTVYALSPSGQAAWTYSLPQAAGVGPIPIGKDGTLYVVCQDGNLYSVSSKGLLKWKTKVATTLYQNPAIGSDGTIYTADFKFRYAVSPSGTILWSMPYTSIGELRPAAITSDGTEYDGNQGKQFSAINLDGSNKWSFVGTSQFLVPAVASDGTIYVFSRDGFLNAFSPSGAISRLLIDGLTSIASGHIAIGADGTLYVCGSGFFAIH